MKKFYVIFFSGCVLFSVLLYFPIGWFLGVLALALAALAYQFFSAKIRQIQTGNELLTQQMAELQLQLDHTLMKEEKASREAEQVRKLKQELLTIISHEIRTPMNGIMGTNALLAETTLTNEQKEYSDTIQSCGESLLTTVNEILVNDLLSFSKLQHEGAKLEFKEFDLRDCVEEVLEMFAAKAGKANVDLLYEIEEDVPEQIIGDNKRLRQVLMNLVENAVRFTPRGDIFLHIRSIKKSGGSPPELIFELRDSGIGIGAEQIKNLFKGILIKETDKNADADSKGLGLVICRKLVEMLGGVLEVDSQLGHGTTFIFNIPIVQSLKTMRSQTAPEAMSILEGKHILLATANTTRLATLSRQLQTWKMSPSGTGTAAGALAKLVEVKNIETIIIDRNLEDMDGIQLAQLIRKQFPSVRMILLHHTGETLSEQESGIFFSIITKPVRQLTLRDNLLGLFSTAGGSQPVKMKNLRDNFSEQFPLRILIAEDNLVNQKIAVKILGKLGYQPDLANNGKEVLEMIGQEYYDVILMDVQMPEMDGLEATKMIRTCLEIQPVIIALTANVMQGDRDACMQAGMDDYLSKPIEIKELIALLEKWGGVINGRRISA